VTELVLSLFPGIGLLDRGFEEAGFCVTRGPDPLWGGDIRKFNPPAGKFTGVIGGPPCQKFSTANPFRDVAGGMELVNEFLRVTKQAGPDWALMENVAGSPTVTMPGMVTQLFTLNASQVGSDQHRLRKFHFFHKAGTPELIIRRLKCDGSRHIQRTCMASEGNTSGRSGGRRVKRRSWAEFCRLQGLPADFDLPGFTIRAKYQAVGNGVPFEMACALAKAIRGRDRGVTPHRVCECGCGQYVHGAARLAGAACRKRMQRLRDAAPSCDAPAAQSNLKLEMETT